MLRKQCADYLRCPPVLEPQSSKPQELANDPELDGHDESNFVFTDISAGVDEHARAIVVREPSGLLRSATPAEHGRLTRVYYQRPFVSPELPKLFYDPYLAVNLNNNLSCCQRDLLHCSDCSS